MSFTAHEIKHKEHDYIIIFEKMVVIEDEGGTWNRFGVFPLERHIRETDKGSTVHWYDADNCDDLGSVFSNTIERLYKQHAFEKAIFIEPGDLQAVKKKAKKKKKKVLRKKTVSKSLKRKKVAKKTK